MCIGDLLKQLRKQSGLSQEQVGKYLGYDQSMITKIEKGDRNISVSFIEKLAPLYGVSVADILSGELKKDPIGLSFRADMLEEGDLDSIAEIRKIAINIREMKEIGKLQN